jgi:hypothetical protein
MDELFVSCFRVLAMKNMRAEERGLEVDGLERYKDPYLKISKDKDPK